jgi:hypothetical protein
MEAQGLDKVITGEEAFFRPHPAPRVDVLLDININGRAKQYEVARLFRTR